MTTAEAIAVIGSWNLGGIYTEENASQVQGRLLNLLNSSRLAILSMFYNKERFIPQEYYQKFEILDVWKDDCPGGFILKLPTTIANMPSPKKTGMDGLFANCDYSKPLNLIMSEREYRDYKTHTAMSRYVLNGVYIPTGTELRGVIKTGELPSKFLVRAVVSDPTKIPNFNIDEDQYPAPDGFMGEIKRMLAGDEGRKAFLRSDQISNSKTDSDDAAAAGR